MNAHDMYTLNNLHESINNLDELYKRKIFLLMEDCTSALKLNTLLQFVKPHLNSNDVNIIRDIFESNQNWDYGNWSNSFKEELSTLENN